MYDQVDPNEPVVPEEITGEELDPEVRRELSTLSKRAAEHVARHLVAAAEFLEEDPERALAHASAARKYGARLAVVRETVGYAAYAAGNYEQALGELRAARRLNGSNDYLPVLADCERGLGRPERALELASSKEGKTLDKAGQIELRIVEAGARRDLGEPEAALRALTISDLESKSKAEWVSRLRYTYADTLESLGRTEEAATWFARAAVADEEGLTDAADRHTALTNPPPKPAEDEDAAHGSDDATDPARDASMVDADAADSSDSGGPATAASIPAGTDADDRSTAADGTPAAGNASAEAADTDDADVSAAGGDTADTASAASTADQAATSTSTEDEPAAAPPVAPVAIFSHPDPDPLRPDSETP